MHTTWYIPPYVEDAVRVSVYMFAHIILALLARGSHLMVGYLLLQSYNTRVEHMRGKTC